MILYDHNYPVYIISKFLALSLKIEHMDHMHQALCVCDDLVKIFVNWLDDLAK